MLVYIVFLLCTRVHNEMYCYVFKHESELETGPSNESCITRLGWDGGYQTKASSSVNLCYLEPLLSSHVPRPHDEWNTTFSDDRHHYIFITECFPKRWMGRGKERTGGAVNQAEWETHVWDLSSQSSALDQHGMTCVGGIARFQWLSCHTMSVTLSYYWWYDVCIIFNEGKYFVELVMTVCTVEMYVLLRWLSNEYS